MNIIIMIFFFFFFFFFFFLFFFFFSSFLVRQKSFSKPFEAALHDHSTFRSLSKLGCMIVPLFESSFERLR